MAKTIFELVDSLASSHGELPKQDSPTTEVVNHPSGLDAVDITAIRTFLAMCTTMDGVPLGIDDSGQIVSLQ